MQMEKIQKYEYDQLTGDPDQKLKRLQDLLKSIQPGIIAFSGGLDSRFLASLICLWQLDYQAIFFSGPHLTRFEKEFAISMLKELKIPYKVSITNPLNISKVASNKKKRCYYCKSHLFAQAMIKPFIRGNKTTIIDGSNTTDSSQYRPGQQALFELGVLSPLQTCGFSKKEIRSYAQSLGFQAPAQPSRPCLLTRFPYNFLISEQLLNQVSETEDSLYHLGLWDFRVRVLHNKRCCLQISENEKNSLPVTQVELEKVLKGFGWEDPTIFFTDNLSGFFD